MFKSGQLDELQMQHMERKKYTTSTARTHTMKTSSTLMASLNALIMGASPQKE